MSKSKGIQLTTKLPLYLYTLRNSTNNASTNFHGKKVKGREAKTTQLSIGNRSKNSCSRNRRLRAIAPNTRHLISGYIRNVQFLLPHDNIYYNIPSFVSSWLSLYYTEQRTLRIDVFHRQIADNMNKPTRHFIHIQNGNNIKDLSNMIADIYGTKSEYILFYSNKNYIIDKKYDNKLLIDKIPHCTDDFISCYILKDWEEDLSPKYFKNNNLSTFLCKISHCTIISKIISDNYDNDASSANNWDFSVGNKFKVKDNKNGKWYNTEIKYHKNDKEKDEEAVYVHFIGWNDEWDEWIFINNYIKCDCSRECIIQTHRIRPVICESVHTEFGKPFIISILNTTTNRSLYRMIYERMWIWIGDIILKQPPHLLKYIKLSKNGKTEYHAIGRSSQEISKYEKKWNRLLKQLPFKLILKNIHGEIIINDSIFNFERNKKSISIVIEWKENAYYIIKDLMDGVDIDNEYREWKNKQNNYLNLKKIDEATEDIESKLKILSNLTKGWKLNDGNKIDIKDYGGHWYVAEIKKHFKLNPLIKSTDTFIMNESIIITKKNISMNDNNPLSTENILIDTDSLCECNNKCKNIKHRIAKINTQSKYKLYGFIPDKHGYLKKQSLYLKKFRTRWMVLKKNKLYSFKNINDNKTTEIFDLNIYDEIKNLKTKQCSKNCIYTDSWQFQISSSNQDKNGNKPRQFIASSKYEMIEWIECIQNAQWTFDIASVSRPISSLFTIN